MKQRSEGKKWKIKDGKWKILVQICFADLIGCGLRPLSNRFYVSKRALSFSIFNFKFSLYKLPLVLTLQLPYNFLNHLKVSSNCDIFFVFWKTCVTIEPKTANRRNIISGRIP